MVRVIQMLSLIKELQVRTMEFWIGSVLEYWFRLLTIETANLRNSVPEH